MTRLDISMIRSAISHVPLGPFQRAPDRSGLAAGLALFALLVVAACNSNPPSAIPTSPDADFPLQPLPTLRPVPTPTPLTETCDPVQRAQLTRYEGTVLPAPAPLTDFRRIIFLPAASAIADGAAVIGTFAKYSCTPPDSDMPPCPSNPATICPTATPHIDWVPDIEAPKDHSRAVSLGPLDGQPFEILVNTADVEFFASTLVFWTDDVKSGFDGTATKLSPQVSVADGASLYSYPALPQLTPGADYLLTVRLKFPGDNEITYLWRIPG